MIVLVALTAGLVFLIVAWALGAKPFDAFLLTSLITLSAAAVRMAMPFVAERLRGDPGPPG